MKLKFTILSAFCLLLFACPSADDGNNETTVAVTPTNYVYEGDLYRFALTSENEMLAAQIEIWQAIGDNDPGFDQAQIDIANANEAIAVNSQVLEELPTGIGFGLPPRPIPPVPPIPCSCFDLFDVTDYIVTDESNLGLVATLYNNNQEEVYSTDLEQASSVEGFQGTLKAFNFNALQDNFTGNGFLQINVIEADENVRSYSINVTVNPVE